MVTASALVRLFFSTWGAKKTALTEHLVGAMSRLASAVDDRRLVRGARGRPVQHVADRVAARTRNCRLGGLAES